MSRKKNSEEILKKTGADESSLPRRKISPRKPSKKASEKEASAKPPFSERRAASGASSKTSSRRTKHADPQGFGTDDMGLSEEARAVLENPLWAPKYVPYLDGNLSEVETVSVLQKDPLFQAILAAYKKDISDSFMQRRLTFLKNDPHRYDWLTRYALERRSLSHERIRSQASLVLQIYRQIRLSPLKGLKIEGTPLQIRRAFGRLYKNITLWSLRPESSYFLGKMLGDLGAETTLCFDKKGVPDVLVKGQKLYGGRVHEYIEKNMNLYKQRPVFVRLNEPSQEAIDPHTVRYAREAHHIFEKNDINFVHSATFKQSFHVLSMGLGLGLHLERLVLETGARTLMIFEENREFILWSFFVTDWGRVLNRVACCWIIPNVPIAGIASMCRGLLSYTSSVAVDRMLIVQHYPSKQLMLAAQELLRTQEEMITALGFFEDETWMTRNTFRTMTQKTNKMFSKRTERLDVPIFVVGSGPSLDRDLPVLKKYQSRAIVIACGTALYALDKAGVKADIFILLERDEGWGETIAKMAETMGLSKMYYVGTSTAMPSIPGHFKDSIIFIRDVSPATYTDPTGKYRLSACGPMVGNSGAAYGASLFSREVYLFGMDGGAKEPSAHHAKTSYNNLPQKNIEIVKSSLTLPVAGNFGGIIYTSPMFKMQASMMGGVARSVRKTTQFYNCSDGVLIENVTPIESQFIKLPPLAESKRKTLQKIVEDYNSMESADFAKQWAVYMPDWQFVDFIYESFLALDDTLFAYNKMYLKHLQELVFEHSQSKAVGSNVFWGSMQHALMIFEYFSSRIEKKEDIAIASTLFAQSFKSFCAFMLGEMMSLMDTLFEEAPQVWLYQQRQTFSYPFDRVLKNRVSLYKRRQDFRDRQKSRRHCRRRVSFGRIVRPQAFYEKRRFREQTRKQRTDIDFIILLRAWDDLCRLKAGLSDKLWRQEQDYRRQRVKDMKLEDPYVQAFLDEVLETPQRALDSHERLSIKDLTYNYVLTAPKIFKVGSKGRLSLEDLIRDDVFRMVLKEEGWQAAAHLLPVDRRLKLKEEFEARMKEFVKHQMQEHSSAHNSSPQKPTSPRGPFLPAEDALNLQDKEIVEVKWKKAIQILAKRGRKL